MSVQGLYSPLCDSNLEAYLAYLAVVNGAIFEQYSGSAGRRCGSGRCGGDNNVGSGVDSAVFAGNSATNVVRAECDSDSGVVSESGVEYCGAQGAVGCSQGLGRVSVDFPGYCCCHVRDCGGVVDFRRRLSHSTNRLRSLVEDGFGVELVEHARCRGGDSGGNRSIAVGFDGNNDLSVQSEKQLDGDVAGDFLGSSGGGAGVGGFVSASDGAAASFERNVVVGSHDGGCVGISGDVGEGVADCRELKNQKGGPNLARNREWRAERKEKKKEKKMKLAMVEERKRGYFSEISEEQFKELRDTRARRLIAENRVAAARADQQLAVVESVDLEAVKKRKAVRIMRDTEVDKVRIERAFGTLVSTGNVSGVGGSVKTVVSDGSSVPELSCSISPSSSVSAKEVREMQQKNLELECLLEKLKFEDSALYLKITRKVRGEDGETVKTGWTPEPGGGYPMEMLDCFNCDDIVKGVDGRYHGVPGFGADPINDNYDF